jgi:hypothetical protein
MMDVPGDSFLLSTNQILVRRTRLILLICLVGGFVFTMLQVAIWRPGSEPTLIVHFIGLVAATTGLIVLQNAWAVRHAWTMAIAAVSAAYVLTAIGRATTVSGEYVTTSILFVGAALVTGTIIPWGLWSQAFTVGIAATSLLAAVWYRDHHLAIAAPDAAVAVVVGFSLSLVAARDHQLSAGASARADRSQTRRARRAPPRGRPSSACWNAPWRSSRARRAASPQAELAHVLRLHTIGEMASALAHEINQPLARSPTTRRAPCSACGRHRRRRGPRQPARRSPTRASAPAILRSIRPRAAGVDGQSRRRRQRPRRRRRPRHQSAGARAWRHDTLRGRHRPPTCRPTAPRSSR